MGHMAITLSSHLSPSLLASSKHPVECVPKKFSVSRKSSSVCTFHRTRLISLSVSARGKKFTGLRMNTEGLNKRSRDPQVQGAVESEAKFDETLKKTRQSVAATISKPGVKSLIVAVAIPLILGSIDGFVNSPKTEWYMSLKKPSWQPPSFVFGGTWSVLYPLMGLASWLVWVEGGFQAQGKALTLYAIQLVLNLLWPAIFFGKQNLGLALVDIVALNVVLFATARAFKPVNHVAAHLMKPYTAWVVFATILNASLWYMNRNTLTAADQPHAE